MDKKSLPEMQISDKVEAIPEALSVYINNLVYALKRDGANITTLSLGEAFFDIPMQDFSAIDFKKGYHYSESLGLPELRKRICKYYEEKYGAPVDDNKEILISAGSKPIIFMALQAVLNPGDEVLIHEPAWLSYPEQIKLADGKPIFIPYDCEPENFIDYVTDKTKVLILNNPNNPAGKIYSKESLKKLYEQFRKKGIYILVDEAYSDFVVEDNFVSMANIVPDKDGIIVVNSLSKNFGISGWRVGYVISSERVIYNILKLNQHLITCPATLLLLYLEKYFDQIASITLPQAIEVVEKRKTVDGYIREKGMKTLDGSSTFYLFVSMGEYRYSSLDLAMYLLFKYRIAVVPGSAYGKSTDHFIRIGVGAETVETIQKSVDIIKRVIDTQEFDGDFVNNEIKRLGFKEFK